MSYRAAVILIENGRLAMIERHRQGQHYFTFPGGHVDPGETPERAAAREVEEELGLRVSIIKLLAEIWWQEKPQYYYLAETVSGTFGTGRGKEILHPHPEKGSYVPVWLPLSGLLDKPVRPRLMAEMVVRAQTAGWPEPAPVLHE
jgi:8-oxo-dGTP pyrophosphatase MutT (NUDIX family)